jgi:ABC-2 type transport system ATP-binding protein
VRGIEVDRLHLQYRTRRDSRLAVHDVSFTVPAGNVVGLLGPNGAGKTSTVRVLATLLQPTSGSVRVGGIDVTRDPRAVKLITGVSFGGETGLYERLTGRENLRYFSKMYPRSAVKPGREGQLLDQVGLAEAADRRVSGYSRGMKQRLHLARAMLHEPPILLLDEPSSGLDPAGSYELRSLVATLVDQSGATVLLTTHDLRECEDLCSRVLIMSQGSIISDAEPKALRRDAARNYGHKVVIRGSNATAGDWSATLGQAIVSSQDGPEQVTLITHQVNEVVRRVLDSEPGALISVEDPTLEEAYLRVVG